MISGNFSLKVSPILTTFLTVTYKLKSENEGIKTFCSGFKIRIAWCPMDKTSQIQYYLIQNCFGDTHELPIQKQRVTEEQDDALTMTSS